MRTYTVFAIVVLFLLAALSGALAVREQQPAITEHLPADPAMAGVYRFQPATLLDTWIGQFSVVTGEKPREDYYETLDAKIGMSVKDDVLNVFGPELAFALDLPPFEEVFVGDDPFGGAQFRRFFEGLLILARFDDRERAVRALNAVALIFESTLTIDGERFTIAADSTDGWDLTFHGRIGEHLLVVAGSPARVDETFAGYPQGRRLVDGADFSRIVPEVDAEAEMLTYVNLPGLRRWLTQGGFLGMKGMERMAAFLTDEWMGVGLIKASRRTNGGRRTTRFGPEAWTGDVAWLSPDAWAVPTFLGMLGKLDDVKQAEARPKGTMADLRTIGVVMESYAIDANVYPATDGWAAVETIRSQVEPTYVRVLPTVDEWDQPIMLWSDGQSYRILSVGSDGYVDRDWSDPDPRGGPTTEPGADIVFADGQFIAWPEGSQN